MPRQLKKRNTVENEILINKKFFYSLIKKGLFSIKKGCLQRKIIRSHRKKVGLHTQNKPTANSCDKYLTQIPTTISWHKSPGQIAAANSHGIANKYEGVPILLTHVIIKSFMF